jgi:ArsR family transcriptional regulator
MKNIKPKQSEKHALQEFFSEKDLGKLCKALGHPTRVRLIRILIEKGECISGDLADEFSLAPSTVSEHLRILKEAGLVQGTIDGPRRCYCINKDCLSYFRSLVKQI